MYTLCSDQYDSEDYLIELTKKGLDKLSNNEISSYYKYIFHIFLNTHLKITINSSDYISSKNLLLFFKEFAKNNEYECNISIVLFSKICSENNLVSKRVSSGIIYTKLLYINNDDEKKQEKSKIYDTPIFEQNNLMSLVAYGIENVYKYSDKQSKYDKNSYKNNHYSSNYNSYLMNLESKKLSVRIYKRCDIIQCKSLIIENYQKIKINNLIVFFDNNKWEWDLPFLAMNITYINDNMVIDLSDIPNIIPYVINEVANIQLNIDFLETYDDVLNAEIFLNEIYLDQKDRYNNNNKEIIFNEKYIYVNEIKDNQCYINSYGLCSGIKIYKLDIDTIISFKLKLNGILSIILNNIQLKIICKQEKDYFYLPFNCDINFSRCDTKIIEIIPMNPYINIPYIVVESQRHIIYYAGNPKHEKIMYV